MTRAASTLWVFAVAGVLFVLRFGYEVGSGDQEELFSLLLHAVDPSLFARDWYVTEQGGQFNVRTPFIWLMSGLMTVLSLEAAALVLFVAAWLGVAVGLHRLATTLDAPPAAAALATLVALVAVPTWTLGGNALVSDLLAPEMIAWAVALAAVREAAKGRPVRAGLLLGAAAYLQLLVGALVTGALGLALVLGARRGRPAGRWRAAVTLGLSALVVALPMVLGVVSYRAGGAPPPDDGLSSFFLIAELRLPHHYLPSAYGLGRWARFGLLLTVGLGALAWLRRRGTPAVFTERLLLAIGLLAAVAGLAIEGAQSLFVAQLQVFKLTVLANALLVIAASTALARAVPALTRWTGLTWRTSGVLAGLVVAAGLGALASGALDARIGPRARAATPVAAVEVWIRRHTPRDALVAIPPSNSTFRLAARRSVVATYKPAPFQDGAMHEWFARLSALAPGADAEAVRGLAFGDELDRAYAQNDADDWARLRAQYGITHVVRDTSRGGAPAGPRVFAAGRWSVYDVAAASGEGDG